MGQVGDLPKEVPSDFEENETFLKQAHRALMEVHIINQKFLNHISQDLF